MRPIPTFAEYLKQRRREAIPSPAPPPRPDGPGKHAVPIAEKLIPGWGKAVNPARSVTPFNSKLLAFLGRKRLKSQVVGR
jgi:hypothetical protein